MKKICNEEEITKIKKNARKKANWQIIIGFLIIEIVSLFFAIWLTKRTMGPGYELRTVKYLFIPLSVLVLPFGILMRSVYIKTYIVDGINKLVLSKFKSEKVMEVIPTSNIPYILDLKNRAKFFAYRIPNKEVVEIRIKYNNEENEVIFERINPDVLFERYLKVDVSFFSKT